MLHFFRLLSQPIFCKQLNLDSYGKIILSSYSPPNEPTPTTIMIGDFQLQKCWKPVEPVALGQLTCGRMFDLGRLALKQRSLVPVQAISEETPGIINNILNISADMIKFSAVIMVPWFCIAHLYNETGTVKTNHLAVLTSQTNITCTVIEVLKNTPLNPLLLETKSSDEEDHRAGEETKEEMSSTLKNVNPDKMKVTKDASTAHIASNPSNADSFFPTTCSAKDHGLKDATLEEMSTTLKGLLKIAPENMPAVLGCLSSNQSCAEITNPNISLVTDGQNAPKRKVCRDEIIAPANSKELTKHPDVTPPVRKMNYAAALKTSSANNFMTSIAPPIPPSKQKRKVPQKGIT